MTAAGAVDVAPSAFAGRGLPRPTPVVVTAVTSRTISLNIGGSTVISQTEIGIAWTASTTPNVYYEITLNGVGNQSTQRTAATLSESLNCYPNPCAGTGVKPGQVNVIRVQAFSQANGSFGDSSPVVELSVFVPNA